MFGVLFFEIFSQLYTYMHVCIFVVCHMMAYGKYD